MKTTKFQAKNGQEVLLTPGNVRGLQEARKLVEKLKKQYRQGTNSTHSFPEGISVMAGPTKKER